MRTNMTRPVVVENRQGLIYLNGKWCRTPSSENRAYTLLAKDSTVILRQSKTTFGRIFIGILNGRRPVE